MREHGLAPSLHSIAAPVPGGGKAAHEGEGAEADEGAVDAARRGPMHSFGGGDGAGAAAAEGWRSEGVGDKTSSLTQLAPTIANACPSILSARSPHSPFHAALQGPSKEAVTLLCIAEV